MKRTFHFFLQPAGRYFLSLLAILFAAHAQAQNGKIIFFRGYNPFADDMYNHNVKLLTPGGAAVIGKIGMQTVCVYDNAQPGATFYIGHDHAHRVTANAPEQFVKVSNRFWYMFIRRYKLKTYTAEEFQHYYDRKRWLRRNLAKQGYPSVNNIIRPDHA